MIFRQLFDSDSSTYTYLLADTQSRQTVIVDPLRRDLGLVKEFDRKLVYILETHMHADHVTEASALKQVTGAQTSVSRHCGTSSFDQLVDNGNVLKFGGEPLLVIATPGHNPGSSCSLVVGSFTDVRHIADRRLRSHGLPARLCQHVVRQHYAPALHIA